DDRARRTAPVARLRRGRVPLRQRGIAPLARGGLGGAGVEARSQGRGERGGVLAFVERGKPRIGEVRLDPDDAVIGQPAPVRGELLGRRVVHADGGGGL